MADTRISRIDRMFYNAEVPANWVNIIGMVRLADRITPDELRHLIESRLLQYPRFRQRIEFVDGEPHWHDHDRFDASAHIRHIALPDPGGRTALADQIGWLMGTPIDKSRPLWDVHLIDDGDQSILVWRIHHTVADGIALIKVVLSMTGPDPETSLADVDLTEHPSTRRTGLRHLLHLGGQLYKDAAWLAMNPDKLVHRVFNAWDSMVQLTDFLTRSRPDDDVYGGELGGRKLVAWSDPVPLDVVKRAARSQGATVNDALLALMTEAARHHLTSIGHDPDRVVSVVAPVNMRSSTEEVRIENKIGFITLDLPTHIEDMGERLASIHETTDMLKHSPEPALIYSTLSIVSNVLKPEQEQTIAALIGKKIDGVISNVPGPQETVYMSGRTVEELIFWIPQTNSLGIGMGLVSYAGGVSLGVSTDATVIPDPEILVEGYLMGFEKLRDLLDDDTDDT